MIRQCTLKNVIRASGVGLHSGRKIYLALRPAPANTGIIFRRVDLENVVEIKVYPVFVGDITLATTLSRGDVSISNVEHLLSAMAMFGIDNAYVDVSAPEVPIMDGSAGPFVFLIQSAGIEQQNVPEQFTRIRKPDSVDDGNKWARFDGDDEADDESPPPTLDEIRGRLASENTLRFGEPIAAQGHKALRKEIAQLRDTLKPRSPARGEIGHNRPPESLTLSVELIEGVTEAADEIDREISKAVPDVDAVVEATGRLGMVLGWFVRKLDVSVDSFMKTLGALGAGAIVAGLAGFPCLEMIAKVYRAALKWLDAVLPPF